MIGESVQHGARMTKARTPTTVAFVSQKGGVGKSALARLLAVGAIHRGRKTLLADLDRKSVV